MNSTYSKQSAGYFREKALIGLSTLTGDEVDKAIIKVSSHKLKAPKEKYMQSLLAASYGHLRQRQKNGYAINEYIVRELEKRSHTHNWIIVLKTMVVLHRLLTDGSDDIVQVICRASGTFSVHNIKELADTLSGAAQKYFIQEYMCYLEERAVAQRQLGFTRRFETKEFDDYMNALTAVELLEPFEALLRMLEALLLIYYRPEIVDNFCTLEAYQSVIRDGKMLFQLLSKRLVYVLGGFEDLSPRLKKMWLQLYKRFEAATAKLKALFDAMIASHRVFDESIPVLSLMPPSLLDRLEQEAEVGAKPQVESLASLGIKSEEPRRETEERLPLPPTAIPRAQPVKPQPELPPPPAPVPAAEPARRPVRPVFTMEDLFQPAPVQQQQQQQQPFQQVPPPQPQDGFSANATPQTDGWSTGAPATNAAGWFTGAPTGWSTGAPEPAPAQSHQSPAQFPPQQQGFAFQGDSNNVAQAPPPQQPQALQHVKPKDPFKDLYSSSQHQWS